MRNYCCQVHHQAAPLVSSHCQCPCGPGDGNRHLFGECYFCRLVVGSTSMGTVPGLLPSAGLRAANCGRGEYCTHWDCGQSMCFLLGPKAPIWTTQTIRCLLWTPLLPSGFGVLSSPLSIPQLYWVRLYWDFGLLLWYGRILRLLSRLCLLPNRSAAQDHSKVSKRQPSLPGLKGSYSAVTYQAAMPMHFRALSFSSHKY